MSKHLAISSSVLLHLSANPFCCGVSGMAFSCRMPASKEYILNCSERNSFALSCLSFLGVPTLRKNCFRLASASLFALSQSTNTNFVYWSANTMQNRNPGSDSTLNGPITSVNNLSSFSSAWVSATLGTGVFVILANAHTLHTSSSFPLSLVYSWTHPLDSNDPIVCATSLHCQVLRWLNTSWILERWKIIKRNCFSAVSFTRNPFWSFMQFLFAGAAMFPPRASWETDRRFENYLGTHKKFLSRHWSFPLVDGMMILRQPLPPFWKRLRWDLWFVLPLSTRMPALVSSVKVLPSIPRLL